MPDPNKKFAIRYDSPTGVKCWVVIDRSKAGGVGAVPDMTGDAPWDFELKVFEDRTEAEAMARNWTGYHPYTRDPSGPFEVVTVKPRMVEIQRGWVAA